jgi:uncharacterized repeat protein (TIGR03803 family)
MPRRILTLSAVGLLAVLVFVLGSLAAPAATFKLVYVFDGQDGGGPYDLVFDNAGNMYGATGGGGNSKCFSGCGTVFQLIPASGGGWRENILHVFAKDSGDGFIPSSGVILDKAGSVYGETLNGGAFGQGTVYRLAPNGDGSWTETILHSFAGASLGSAPGGGLVMDGFGDLYGVAGSGTGGLVFELTPTQGGTWTCVVLYEFRGWSDGVDPTAVTLGPDGDLYGTTYAGGSANCIGGCGTVFRLSSNQNGEWTKVVLHRFTGGTDGRWPIAGVTVDSRGSIYGTTGYGGQIPCPGEGNGCGVIYRLSPNSSGKWEEQVLHTFGYGNDGLQPWGPVTLDNMGHLYGTTFFGGSLSQGTLFELVRDSTGHWSEKQLHAFSGGLDGYSPRSRLELDSSGRIFSSASGGALGWGTVFEVSP